MKTNWEIRKQEFRTYLFDTPRRSKTTIKSEKSTVSGVISHLNTFAKLMNKDESEIYSMTNDDLLKFYNQVKIEIKGDERYFYKFQLALRKYLRFCKIDIDPIRKTSERNEGIEIPAQSVPKNLTPVTDGEGCVELPIRAFRSKSGAIYLKIG